MILTTCFRCHKLIRLSGTNWTGDDGSTRCPGEGNEFEFHIPPMKFLILEQVWNEMTITDRETRNTSTKRDYMLAITESFAHEMPGNGRHHPDE